MKKKHKIYQIKPFKVIAAQIATTFLDHNLLLEIFFAEDLLTEKFHETIHKTYKVDQILEITEIAITTEDQIQIEANTRTIIEIILIQTIEIDTILKTVP